MAAATTSVPLPSPSSPLIRIPFSIHNPTPLPGLGPSFSAEAIPGCSQSSASLLNPPPVASSGLGDSITGPPPCVSPPNLRPVPPSIPRPASRWVGLFQGAYEHASSSRILPSFTPSFVNGVAVAPPSVVEKGVEKWRKFLVGSFLDKKMPFFLVERELVKILKSKAAFDLSSDGDQYYIDIKEHAHRQLILEGGPIFVAGRIMIVREWSSLLEGKDDLKSIPIWINLQIPRELWTVEGIGFCASLFGEPLGMDAVTAKMMKVKFTRVCVEVNPEFKFPEVFSVDIGSRVDVVKAEYKWRPSSCSNCLRFGHSTIRYPKNQIIPRVRVTDSPRRVNTVAVRQWAPRVCTAADVPATELLPVQQELGTPVAVTGTSPLGHSTNSLVSREETPLANRFGALAELAEVDGNCGVDNAVDNSDTAAEVDVVEAGVAVIVAQMDEHSLQYGSKVCSMVSRPGQPETFTMIDKGGTKSTSELTDLDIEKERARLAISQAEGDEMIRRVLDRVNQQSGPTLRSANKPKNHKGFKVKA